MNPVSLNRFILVLTILYSSLLDKKSSNNCFVNGQGLVYYVAPTDAVGASDSAGYGTRTNPFKTVDYAAGKLNGVGGTVILLDGVYINSGFQDGNIWKSSGNTATANTVRVNNKHGTSNNPIIIKGDSPAGHVLKGDGDNIFQLRVSSHFVLENLNILGEVQNIPLQEAFSKRFDYKTGTDNTVYQRADPALAPQQIEALTLQDISKQSIYRPSKYSTTGLLVQSCRYITVNNCTVGYMPGTGLRVQSSDFVDLLNNVVHNSSRRGSVGNHGLVVHSLTNTWNTDTITSNDYRMKIVGNTIVDNYNEVYSWSELKTFITPYIDEGKGLTIQKSSPADSSFDYGRILIANNVAYGNGFSGIHTNFAERVDIFFNTVVNNTRTSTGSNTGISVSDSKKCRIVNNIAYSLNSFGGYALSTDSTNLAADEISFLNNLVIGYIDPDIPSDLQFTSTHNAVRFVNAPLHDYRILTGSSAVNLGSSLTQGIVEKDKKNATRVAPTDVGAFEAFSLTNTSSGGDPHFQTWHGEWFSYHGACDLVLLKSKTFGDGVGLRIHIRTEGRNLFSFIRNVAIQIGDEIFEIEGDGKPWDKSALVNHYYNTMQNVKLPISMLGKYIVSKKVGKRNTFDTVTYTIHLDHAQSIEVLVWKGFLHVSLTADVISCGLEDSVGLMGTWNKVGKYSRDGLINMMNPDDFAQEWQVLSSESMIFQTLRAPQHPEKCIPSAAERRHRRLGENGHLHNMANEACANVMTQRKELCVFDIIATGDMDMAKSPFYLTFD